MIINFYRLTLLLVFATTVDYRFFAGIPGIPSVTLTEIIAYPMVILYAGRELFETSIVKEEILLKYRNNRILFWYFLWAALAAIVASVFRSEPEVLKVFKNLLPSLMVYYFVSTYCNNVNRVKNLIRTYLFGIFINLMLGLSQYLTDWPRPVQMNDIVAEKMDIAGNVINRVATGLFNHPNGLAVLLLPAIILIVALLVKNKSDNILRFPIILIYLVLIVFVLKVTYAKGVFAWAIVGIGLLFLPEKFARWRFGLGLITLIAGITGISYFSFQKAITEGGALETIISRMMLWVAALDVIQSSNYIKIFGNGFKAMDVSSIIFADWQYPNAHNGILNQIIFYGIPAFILYLAMYVKAIKNITDAMLNSQCHLKTECLFIYSALIALFGEYFFEPANDGVVLQSHLFLLYALVQVLSKPMMRVNYECCE
jgi:O-antigen ligase